jgi:hypothetical protein
MKKLVTVVLLTVSMFACQKEEEVKPCNCGVITDDAIEFDSNGNIFYTLTIKNDCSNNLGTYYFSQDVWMDAPVGSDFCVTNVSSWMPVGQTTSVKVENKVVQ